MPAPLGVHIDGVHKRFGEVVALAELSLSIDPGQSVGLLGSSGSGKTTLLRIVAGLEHPDRGSVKFTSPTGETISSRPATGMVFQNLALWPHLTARQHVACVLNARLAGEGHSVESLLNDVHLPAAAWDRRPNQLSGGEGQRVALARALACRPQLLLLDEPLVHLDAALRSELLEQIAETVRRLGITTVYVTHAWDEAAALCDKILLMDRGRVLQSDSPSQLFWRPANLDVARITGPLVVVPRTWIAEGRIEADPSLPNWPGICESTDEQCYFRPQQLKVFPHDHSQGWRVLECRPQAAGWLLRLENEAGGRLSVPSATPADCNRFVRLQVQVTPH